MVPPPNSSTISRAWNFLVIFIYCNIIAVYYTSKTGNSWLVVYGVSCESYSLWQSTSWCELCRRCQYPTVLIRTKYRYGSVYFSWLASRLESKGIAGLHLCFTCCICCHNIHKHVVIWVQFVRPEKRTGNGEDISSHVFFMANHACVDVLRNKTAVSENISGLILDMCQQMHNIKFRGQRESSWSLLMVVCYNLEVYWEGMSQ